MWKQKGRQRKYRPFSLLIGKMVAVDRRHESIRINHSDFPNFRIIFIRFMFVLCSHLFGLLLSAHIYSLRTGKFCAPENRLAESWTGRKTWPKKKNKIKEMDWLPNAMYFVLRKTKVTHTIRAQNFTMEIPDNHDAHSLAHTHTHTCQGWWIEWEFVHTDADNIECEYNSAVSVAYTLNKRYDDTFT